jgi:dTDP-4-dehydrorhamnose reductase
MRILVTGAKGLLGSTLVPRLQAGHEVTGVDLDDFDIADLDATLAGVGAVDPDAIVHAAAWANVDGAEAEEAGAFRANALGAKNVALAANEAGARILHISTDYVFDGLSGSAYIESDTPNPTGVYGRSKWMGEQFVRTVADRWTVVRTQALYGTSGPSFVKAIRKRVEDGQPLTVVDDQTVCPTRAADLSDALVRILEEGTNGLYHASSRGECTWFTFAKAILELTGAPDHPLSPITTEQLARPAPRPPYSVLRNLHLEMSIGDTLPHWKDALAEHLAGDDA